MRSENKYRYIYKNETSEKPTLLGLSFPPVLPAFSEVNREAEVYLGVIHF